VAIAYILIVVESLKEHTVYCTLCKANEIDEVYPLFGEWDIIARVSAEDKEELKNKILEKVIPIDGILATKTLIGY